MRTDQLGDPYRPRAAGEIDAPFLARYNRLVAVTKLITMQNTDKTSVPVFKAELERFVLDVLGEELKGEGKNPSYSIGSRFPLPVPVRSRPLFSPDETPSSP